ncbi:MAG: PTS sugar transporter subunit IIA, partial [Polyangiaceae bacterium]
IEGLQKPLLALGVSRLGVDFNSVDGRPANVIFLLLMPPRHYEEEVRILAGIARAVIAEASREQLLRATTLEDALGVLATDPTAAPPRARRASLADV